MSGITSHVLDTSRGQPASGIEIVLERATGGNDANTDDVNWQQVGTGTTNEDGRCPGLTGEIIEAEHYRMNFLVKDYFHKLDIQAFYPVVRIEFSVDDAGQHYHVPLLLNPFGYSTYRGS